jgi:hypothetical protein
MGIGSKNLVGESKGVGRANAQKGGAFRASVLEVKVDVLGGSLLKSH